MIKSDDGKTFVSDPFKVNDAKWFDFGFVAVLAGSLAILLLVSWLLHI